VSFKPKKIFRKEYGFNKLCSKNIRGASDGLAKTEFIFFKKIKLVVGSFLFELLRQ